MMGKFFEEKLNVAAKIVDVFPIKERSGTTLPITKLENMENKQAMMKNKNQLEGGKLYVNYDRTTKERDPEDPKLRILDSR